MLANDFTMTLRAVPTFIISSVPTPWFKPFGSQSTLKFPKSQVLGGNKRKTKKGLKLGVTGRT